MSTIIHAPNHIGIITIVQSSTICESTNVLTNHCWLAIVMLKLNPANFLGKFAEFFYQYIDVSNHMLSSSLIIDILFNNTFAIIIMLLCIF